MKALLAGLSAVALLAASPVEAQLGSTKGVFAGAQFTGASLNVKDAASKLDFGGGYGLHAGVGFSNRWSLLINYDKSTLKESGSEPFLGLIGEDVELVQYDAIVRANLISEKYPVRPFLAAGLTGRAAEGSTKFDGVSPTAGAGVIVKVLPRLAITGSALFTFGNLKSVDDVGAGEDEFNATGTRVQIGASLFLFGH